MPHIPATSSYAMASSTPVATSSPTPISKSIIPDLSKEQTDNSSAMTRSSRPTRAQNEKHWRDSLGDADKRMLTGIAAEIEAKLKDLVKERITGNNANDGQVMLDALHGTRRICQAWTKYPGVNGFISEVEITEMDYLRTAFEAVKPCEPNVSVQWWIAKATCGKIFEASQDADADADANAVLAEVVRGASAAYCILYDFAESFVAFELADCLDDQEPDTYTHSGLISSETAEELSKGQKTDAAKKKRAPKEKLVESSSLLTLPPADQEDDAIKIYTSGKLLKHASGTSKKTAGRKRKAKEDDNATEQPAPKTRKTGKGRAKLFVTSVIEDSDDEEKKGGDDPKRPVAKTRKQRRKLDGPQEPWLSDEHNLLFTLVLYHPDWDLHKVYVEFNKTLSDTAVRPEGSKLPAGECKFRTTWIPYTGAGMSKDAARARDQKWRSFASLRNRVQWFLTIVTKWRDSDKSKAWMRPLWDPCMDNEAATWPKKDKTPAPPVVRGQYAVYDCASLWDYYALNQVAESVEELKKDGKFPDHVPEGPAEGDDVENLEEFVACQEEDDVQPAKNKEDEEEQADGVDEEEGEDSHITSAAAIAKELQAKYDAGGEAILAARAAAAEEPADQQPGAEEGEGSGEQPEEVGPTATHEEDEKDVAMEDAE